MSLFGQSSLFSGPQMGGVPPTNQLFNQPSSSFSSAVTQAYQPNTMNPRPAGNLFGTGFGAGPSFGGNAGMAAPFN